VEELLAAQFRHLLARRQQGEPVAYVIGRREFYGHEFLVSADTLIPRPDTELLVDIALEKLPEGKALRVADLGTGTGAIAISLGLARPAWQLLAVDYIVAVLDLVERNVRRLHAVNVTPLQSSWYARLDGRFDAIVSNPPYIRADDVHLRRGDVRFEPRSALVSGDDGLDDIRLIIAGAPARLRAGGLLALEHGHDQGAAVRELFQCAGFQSVETRRDYGDNERVTFGFHGASDAQ
jgi:release factor glutamine methyltransferase